MKNKKSMIIAISIFVVIAIIFGITLGLLLSNKTTVPEGSLIIKVNGVEKEYKYEEIMEKAGGEVDFNAVYKPSGKVPVERMYTGLELKVALTALGIDLASATSIRFTASDGLEKMYSIADVMSEKTVYIARLVEGKPFDKGIAAKGSDLAHEDGGEFVVIKATDTVSQNRVRCVVKIEVCYD